MRTPRPVASLPPAASPTAASCSLLAALTVVGDFWTLGAIRCLFNGLTRFGELQRELGIATNVLTDRLGRLVDAGVVARVPLGGGARHRYALTPAGEELAPVLLGLRSWGERHLQADAPAAVWRHRGCRSAAVAEVRCPDCGAAPALADMEVARPGTQGSAGSPPGAATA